MKPLYGHLCPSQARFKHQGRGGDRSALCGRLLDELVPDSYLLKNVSANMQKVYL